MRRSLFASLRLISAILLSIVIGGVPNSDAASSTGRILVVDYPGTSTGTEILGVNQGGQVTGLELTHGFLRNADGTYVAFDPPGSISTVALSINASGEIAGFYNNSAGGHAFIRHSDATITSFDVPGAGGATWANGINDGGWVIGATETSPARLGYVRSPSGVITTFTVNSFSTTPDCINAVGQIAGIYWHTRSEVSHAFLRDEFGNITTFDVPGSLATEPVSINSRGQVTGWYLTADNLYHGFIRNLDSTFATFDAPQAGIVPFSGTLTSAINDQGYVCGYVVRSDAVWVAFVRDPQGTFTLFKAPGSSQNSGEGTRAMSMNNRGAIAGWFFDSTRKQHGFIRY